MSTMRKPTILTGSSSNLGTSGLSFYRMSDAPPDWSETDPSQPDYIANKDLAERVRPVMVEGEVVLDDSRESGPLNFVGGKNIALSADGNTIVISGTGEDDKVRGIYIHGAPFLGENPASGPVNLVGVGGISLETQDNTIYISAKTSEGGSDIEYIEGEGIDIRFNEIGQKVVSIEEGAVSNGMISSVSIDKLFQEEGEILILNGGKANGNYY